MVWKYTNDITDSDLLRLEIFGVAVQTHPLVAGSCWMSESGLLTTAHNPNGHASGIFQAMPDILKGLGYKPQTVDLLERSEQFRAESFSEQIRWAQRFYTPYKGKINTKASFYMATFLPADLDYTSKGDNNTVIVKKNGGKGTGERGWAYNANVGFDANHDFVITVGELEQAIDRACRSNRWKEFHDRMLAQLEHAPVSIEVLPETDIVIDLGSQRGVQQALLKLGFDPGKIDGLNGPNTRAALVNYQKSRGLVVDGIYGPNTRKALTADLAKI